MRRWLKIAGIGCGGLLGLFILLGIVGAIIGGGETATDTDSAQSGQQEAPRTTDAQAQPEEPKSNQDQETQEQAEQEPSPEPEPEPAPEPIALSGTGQSATDPFELEDGLAIFRMTHQGQGNFIVDLLDESGQSAAPMGLVNEIGSFEGSYAQQVIAGQHVLDVMADGAWNITIEQPRPNSAPETRDFEGVAKTATDFFQLSSGLHTVTLTHQGDGNFIVDMLNQNGASVDPMGLVNEIGSFEGSTTVTVPEDGIYLFQVEANGPWTISVE
jgi:hypothetical protein